MQFRFGNLLQLVLAITTTVALADPIVYIVDCPQFGQPLRSYLSYYGNNNAYSQNKPDSAIPFSPSNNGDQFQASINFPNVGTFSAAVTRDLASPYTQIGTGNLNGGNWRCYADTGRLLYTDTSYSTSASPFAQCMTRGYCNPVPRGGSMRIDVQFADLCDGQPTGGNDGSGGLAPNRPAPVNLPRQSTLCGSIAPDNNIFIWTYDTDQTTQLCYDVIELDADTDNIYGKTFTSSKCGTTIQLGSASFGLTSLPATIWQTAPNGEQVQLGPITLGSQYSSPGISSIWDFKQYFYWS